ncbi:MAG: acyl carrier protein [Proteobacteria bacterium]|nr:acyl carrier protein [Pseudomonadota bacterium]MDA0951135.1 acyl carrier protein [Pseudomonadota bacterium]MDA1072299.1 acyl carrier protein [Pseudomonadota bacterium]
MTDPLDRPAIRLLAIEALHRSIGLLNEPAYARLRQEPERDLAFADLELDSLSTLEMLMEIEEAVGIELDPELLPELVTLDALVEHIMASRADA